VSGDGSDCEYPTTGTGSHASLAVASVVGLVLSTPHCSIAVGGTTSVGGVLSETTTCCTPLLLKPH